MGKLFPSYLLKKLDLDSGWPHAWEDNAYWQSEDKKTLKKINALIKDIQRTFEVVK